MPSPRSPFTAWEFTLLLVVVATASLVVREARWEDALVKVPVPSPTVTPAAMLTPSPSASPSLAASPTTAPTVSPSPSPSPTPTPSASAVPVSQLPSSAQTFVANFFAAFKAKDSSRLADMFTPDSTSELHDLRLRLFSLPGNDGGGPTLFSSDSAPYVATGYAISKVSSLGTGWRLNLTEKRVDSTGKPVPDASTVMTLVPSGSASSGTWLIDSYVYAGGSAGKYDAFLLQ